MALTGEVIRTASGIDVRLVSLDPARIGKRRAKRRPGKSSGIVTAAGPETAAPQVQATAAGAAGADLVLPDAPSSTTTSDGGGAKLPQASLQLVFWGSVWADPNTSPSAGDVVDGVSKIVSGPYMGALDQYGAYGAGIRGAFIVLSPTPPSGNTFTEGDIQGLVNDLIDNGDVPERDEESPTVVTCVFMPAGYSKSNNSNVIGEHSYDWDYDFPFDLDHNLYMWVTNDGSLTDSNSITSIFSHELAEVCTDPEGDGIQVDPRNGSSWNEIGDVCSSTAVLDGVSVQSYWSQRDQACIIPTGPVIRDKAILPDTAFGAPAIAAFGEQTLALAWTGTDDSHSLNMESSADGQNFSGKVTLGETSIAGPGLACGDGHAFLSWSGTDDNQSLNVLTTDDLSGFYGKVTLGESSDFCPALAYGDGRLYIAWTGTDDNHSLNVMSSAVGQTFENKVTLGESSGAAPGLAYLNGILFLLWQGTDDNHSLNVLQSADGQTFTDKVTLGDSSDFGPAMAHVGDPLGLAWTGRDSDHHLNLLLSSDGVSYGSKKTFLDTAEDSPSIADWAGSCWISWTGTDDQHHLNVAQLR